MCNDAVMQHAMMRNTQHATQHATCNTQHARNDATRNTQHANYATRTTQHAGYCTMQHAGYATAQITQHANMLGTYAIRHMQQRNMPHANGATCKPLRNTQHITCNMPLRTTATMCNMQHATRNDATRNTQHANADVLLTQMTGHTQHAGYAVDATMS
jgi:hypothetical protein